MPEPALVSISTSWPCATYSRTAPGVNPTRYSWFLISFGHPIRMQRSSPFAAFAIDVPEAKKTRNRVACPCEEELRITRNWWKIACLRVFAKDIRMSGMDAIDLAIMRTLQDNGRI